MFNWKNGKKKKEDEKSKKTQTVAKAVSTARDVNRDAYATWQEDKARRDTGFVPSSKEGASWKEATRPARYNSSYRNYERKENSTSKWRSEIAVGLGKSYGKKYDERVMNALKKDHGMSEGQAKDFMKYMDAKERDAELGKGEYARLNETSNRITNDLVNAEQWRLNVNRSEAAKREESEKAEANAAIQPDEKEQDKDRGFLDRTFDMLLTGNYVSANITKSLLDGKGGYTVKGAVRDGLRAGNPFGEGYEQGEGTYSDVLRTLEDKYGNETSNAVRETTMGKIGIGTAGFVLDVLLDPTTYATFGVSAVVKGAGQLGKVGTTLSKNLSKQYGVATIKSADEIDTIAEPLYNKIRIATESEMVGKSAREIDNVARATTDSLLDSLHVGFKGLDVDTASRIVGRQASKGGVTRTSAQILKDAENLTRKYNQLLGYSRNGKIGVTLGNLPFAEKLVGRNLASKTLGFSDKTVRKLSDKIGASAPYTKLRNGLYASKAVSHLSPNSVLFRMAKESPEQLYKIVNLAEASRGLKGGLVNAEKGVNAIGDALAELAPAQQKEVMELMQNPAKWQRVVKQVRLAETEEAKAFQMALESTRAEEVQQLERLKGMRDNIGELRKFEDNDIFDLKTQLDALDMDYAKQLEELDLELLRGTEAYNDAVATIKALESELSDDFIGKSSDVIKKEVELPELPVEPKKPTMRGKPRAPKLEEAPAEPFLEPVPTHKEFTEVTDGKQRDYLFNKWVEYKGLAYGTPLKREFVDDLNKFIAKDNAISKATYDYEIDRIVKMIEEGKTSEYIKDYVMNKANRYRFDGRAAEIYTHVAQQIGYGAGTKYKNWDEYYTKRMDEINAVRGTAEFTPALRRLEDKLMKDSLIRIDMIARFKNMSMAQIMKEKKLIADSEMWKLHDSRNAELNSASSPRAVEREAGAETLEEQQRKQSSDYELGRTQRSHIGEQVANFSLLSSEIGEVQALVYNTAKKIGNGNILSNGGITSFAIKVSDEVPNVLNATFKKEWSQLTQKQRSYAVSLSVDNVIKGLPDTRNDELVKKLADHVEARLIQRHAQAIDNASKIGDKVLLRESDLVATIENKTSHGDGLVEYTIRHADGTEEVITSDAIGLINSAKPADVLLSQLVKDDLSESYKKVVAEIEERNQQRLFEYATAKSEVDARNAEAMAQYEQRVAEWKAKREADYAEALEKFNKEYPKVLEERARIEALNKATREQFEQAVRLSSKTADEFFERKEQLDRVVKSSQEIASTNSVRGIAVEQIEKVMAEQKAKLLDELKKYEVGSDAYKKLLGTDEARALALKEIDDAIVKLDTDIKVLENTEPIDMEALFAREDNIRRQIEVRHKRIARKVYSDVKPIPRGDGSVTPIKPAVVTHTPEQLKVMEEIKHLEQQMKDIQADISEARNGILIENWREEMSRLVTTKTHLQEQRKFYDGSEDIEKTISDLEASIKNIDATLTDSDLLEAYIKQRVAPEQIKHWYDLANSGKGELDSFSLIDADDYSKLARDTATNLRKQFMKMGLREVEIGRLKQGAFDQMIDEYLPHVLTPAGRKFLRTKEGKNIAEQGGLPFGFYNAENPFAKARTFKQLEMEDGTIVKNPTIEQINRYFKEKHGVEEFFTTNLAEIYLARAMKHNELVYSHDYMENIMTMFGTRITRDNVDQFDSYVVNIGQLKDFVQSKVSQQIDYAVNMGALRRAQNYSEDILKAARHDIMRALDIDSKVLEQDLVPMLSLNKNQVKKLLDEGQDWVHHVDKGIVMKANQSRMIAIERDHNRFLQIFDKFQHWVKLMQTVIAPSFHMRNKLGNMFNSWLSVGGRVNDPRYQKKMFDVVRAQGDHAKLKHIEPLIINHANGTHSTMDWSKVYDTALRYGVIDEGYFAQEFGASVAKGTETTKKLDGLTKGTANPLDMNNFVGFKLGSKWGSYNENMDRLAQFSAHLADGKSADEAKELVDKYLFDYSDLTMFEQRVMKRIFPYYTFWRKNTSLQLRSIDDKSQQMKLVAKAMNAPEGGIDDEDKVERKYVGDFAKSWIQLPMWSKGSNLFNGEEEDEPILLNPALPFMDLDRIPNPFEVDDAFMGVMSQVTPFVKNPFELATNKSTFFNSQISSPVREGEGADATYEYDSGKMAKDYAGHVANQIAPISQIRQLFDKDGTDKGLHTLYMMSGIKAMSYNYGTSKSIAQNKEAYENGYMNEWQKENYEKYQESRSVPFDKVLNWSGENLNIANHHAKLSEKYFTEAGKLTGTIDRWTRGEELTKADEKYKPFIEVMEKVGSKFGKDANATRDFVGMTLDKTALDELALGKDFTTLDVEDVLDGDTFTVNYKGKKRSVRMLLVDTPETSKQLGQPDMAYGREAFKFTSDMIKGKDVQMVIDSRGTDAYGRLLAYVYVDGKLVQSELVKSGLGSVAYSDMKDSERNNYREELLRSLQSIAQQKKRGINSIDGYVGSDGSYDLNSYMTEEEVERYYNN